MPSDKARLSRHRQSELLKDAKYLQLSGDAEEAWDLLWVITDEAVKEKQHAYSVTEKGYYGFY